MHRRQIPYTTSYPQISQVRDEEVLELLTKSLAKSCDLDPFPSKLFVQHHQEVVPILSQIIDASLTEGEFTSELKETLLHPLLKKLELISSLSTTDPSLIYPFCPNWLKEQYVIKSPSM